MTDLELQEEVIEDWAHQFPDVHRCFVNGIKVDKKVYDALDAHLKEDAEIRRGYRTREVEANARRNAAEAQLTELREAVRAFNARNRRHYGCNGCMGDTPEAKRLRQLIEEKE